MGRDEELALCRDTLLDEGRSVVVVAPPGTGKTRLVQAVMQSIGELAVTDHVFATRSAQHLPLAAVAGLVPADATAGEPLDLFRAARRALLERASDRAAVVAVDDAHLLDPLSAALLHHLATTAGARLLVAIRAGEPAEDAITALWRDGVAQRIDLQPLGPDDIAVLLRTVLDGDVDAASARRLWSVTGGNALYLHELVTEALEANTLQMVRGVWRWQGEVRVGARLRELVELRLASLDAEERDVVSLLAVGDVVPEVVVAQACTPASIARLQRRGFVMTRVEREPVSLTLDHPLFAEVVRSAMPSAERAAWCRLLASSIAPTAGDDVARLQRAVWSIDGDLATDADFLTSAADVANKRFDGALAERLARAALAVGAGPRALLARGDAYVRLGRYEDALHDLREVDDRTLSDDDAARLAMLLAEAGFWGAGRLDETNAALVALAQRSTSAVVHQRVGAQQSAMLFATADFPAAASIGLPIATDANGDDLARLRAVTAAAGCLSFGGRPHEALALCDALLPVAFAHADEWQRGVGLVFAQMLLAYTCLARFDESVEMVTAVRESAISDGDDEVVNSATLVLARLACNRGNLLGARTLAREASAGLHLYDPSGYLPWSLGLEAQIAAQLGDASGARAAVDALDHLTWVVRVNDHEVAAGRAWAAAASGELAAPLQILFDAADHARAVDSRVARGTMLHEALRLGARPRDVLDGLRDAASTGDLPYHEVFVAHAEALDADNGPALEAVSVAFEGFGIMLFAAEAAAEAASAHRRAGLTARAERAAGTAARLLVACPGARTPALAQLVDVPTLTRRELEVCRLAAGGLTNSDIAGRLGVGVRTVEGHLLRATTKLGVRSRTEIDAALQRVENA